MYSRLSVLFLAMCSSLSLPVSGKPLIQFTATTFDCGIVVEGKTESVQASFTFRNTGTDTLRIKSVRPGCGCTVVKYDSVIAPGKSSTLQSTVNMKGYRSGQYSKGITVTSNAENEPTTQLTIKFTVESPLDCSESYISLAGSGADAVRTVRLTTKKRDLKITDVVFRPAGEAEGAADWRSSVGYDVAFSVHAVDTVLADGRRVYEVQLRRPAVDKAIHGSFVFRTNHPEKSEITVSGRLAP